MQSADLHIVELSGKLLAIRRDAADVVVRGTVVQHSKQAIQRLLKLGHNCSFRLSLDFFGANSRRYPFYQCKGAALQQLCVL